MCAWDGTGRRRDKEQKSSLLYADVKPRNRESQSIPHEKQGIKLAPHDEGMIRHSIKKIRKIPWNCIWGHESLTSIIKKPKPSIWLTLSIRKTLGGVARSWLQDRQIWLTALCWITVYRNFSSNWAVTRSGMMIYSTNESWSASRAELRDCW